VNSNAVKPNKANFCIDDSLRGVCGVTDGKRASSGLFPTERAISALRSKARGCSATSFDGARLSLSDAESPLFQCRFRWTERAIAFWDNRCAQHRAMWDYWPHPRWGARVTIKGERPVWSRAVAVRQGEDNGNRADVLPCRLSEAKRTSELERVAAANDPSRTYGVGREAGSLFDAHLFAFAVDILSALNIPGRAWLKPV
jgi:hypothetical protein